MGDVELHVAEPVDVDRVGEQPRRRRALGGGSAIATSVVGVARIADLGERRARGQPGRHRGEDVATVEGRRHRLEPKRRVGDVDRLDDPAASLGGQREQAVVGPDQQRGSSASRTRDRAALRPRRRDRPPPDARRPA